MQLFEHGIKLAGLDLKTGNVLATRRNIMCFIEYDHRVGVVNFEYFPNLSVNEVVVRHEDKVSLAVVLYSFSGHVIWAELVPESLLVYLLDIHRIPCHIVSSH